MDALCFGEQPLLRLRIKKASRASLQPSCARAVTGMEAFSFRQPRRVVSVSVPMSVAAPLPLTFPIKSAFITPPSGRPSNPERPYHSVPADDSPDPATLLPPNTPRRGTLRCPSLTASFKRSERWRGTERPPKKKRRGQKRGKKARLRWSEARLSDAESLSLSLSLPPPPQITTLRALCCRMLPVPARRERSGARRGGRRGRRGRRGRKGGCCHSNRAGARVTSTRAWTEGERGHMVGAWSRWRCASPTTRTRHIPPTSVHKQPITRNMK